MIAASATRENITWIAGDTFNVTMRFYSDAAKTVPVNLTGRTYRMQIRDKETNDELLTATTGDGITIGGASSNELAFSFLMDVDAGTHVYDLQETNGTVITTLVGGYVTIKNEVTVQ